MGNRIHTLYVVHHSHTDIGYTDLQENVLDLQTDNIRDVIRLLRSPENREFRWNCETLFIVERFLEEADEEERKEFFACVRRGNIGISLNYLNFNDLLDADVFRDRVLALREVFARYGADLPQSAMCADINGVSMGYRKALLDCGAGFFYMNINTCHGGAPFGKTHQPFRWRAADGRSLLVWSAEHYNLGNALGLRYEPQSNGYFQQYIGDRWLADPIENLHANLTDYLTRLSEGGYPYSFLPVSVSGIFTDNAPANIEILRNIEQYHARYGKDDGITIRMVTVEELYRLIAPCLGEIPEVSGDLNDWWADGVGSTPLAVKHYLSARRQYRWALSLDPAAPKKWEALCREAQANLLLYAEHTWGHSCSVSDPSLGIAGDLDLRKQSYASRANEMTSLLLNRIRREQNAIFRLYRGTGALRVTSPRGAEEVGPVAFEIEAPYYPHILVKNEKGEALPTQCHRTVRGVEVVFTDRFGEGKQKAYTFAPVAGEEAAPAEVARTENGIQTSFFRLEWEPGQGLVRLTDLVHHRELLGQEDVALFRPVYECTPLEHGVMGERGILGQNIRGEHAVATAGELTGVTFGTSGSLYTEVVMNYRLPGCRECQVILTVWHSLPRVDAMLRLTKKLNPEIESVYLPLTLRLPGASLWMRKGGAEAFRPGVDQVPGTCMDYGMSDDGILYRTGGETDYTVTALDTPLYAFAPFCHHAVKGCDGREENNARPVRSWVMNNKWETNFALNLAGFYEFRYRLEMVPAVAPDVAFDRMRERVAGPMLCVTAEQ